MPLLKQKGGTVFIAEAQDWRDQNDTIKMGIIMSQIDKRSDRSLKWMLGQLYGIIENGLINSVHIYQGLNRAMFVNGKADADTAKLVYCLKPNNDFTLTGDRFSPALEKSPKPDGDQVFALIISPNEDLTNFPDIVGWIEHWSWIDSCPADVNRPIDHETRYGQCLK